VNGTVVAAGSAGDTTVGSAALALPDPTARPLALSAVAACGAGAFVVSGRFTDGASGNFVSLIARVPVAACGAPVGANASVIAAASGGACVGDAAAFAAGSTTAPAFAWAASQVWLAGPFPGDSTTSGWGFGTGLACAAAVPLGAADRTPADELSGLAEGRGAADWFGAVLVIGAPAANAVLLLAAPAPEPLSGVGAGGSGSGGSGSGSGEVPWSGGRGAAALADALRASPAALLALSGNRTRIAAAAEGVVAGSASPLGPPPPLAFRPLALLPLTDAGAGGGGVVGGGASSGGWGFGAALALAPGSGALAVGAPGAGPLPAWPPAPGTAAAAVGAAALAAGGGASASAPSYIGSGAVFLYELEGGGALNASAAAAPLGGVLSAHGGGDAGTLARFRRPAAAAATRALATPATYLSAAAPAAAPILLCRVGGDA
jgi:hypothetical protein